MTITEQGRHKIIIFDDRGRFVIGDGAMNEWGRIFIETAPAPPPPVPNAPSDLSATADGSHAIDLSWTDNSDNETGFSIERSPDGVGSWAEIDTVGENVVTYRNDGLVVLTTYWYRVRAFNVSGYSDYSNIASDTTDPYPPFRVTQTMLEADIVEQQPIYVTQTMLEVDRVEQVPIYVTQTMLEVDIWYVPPEEPPTSTPLLISEFTEIHDSHDLVTRIYPRGGGVGDMRPSLEDTTRVVPVPGPGDPTYELGSVDGAYFLRNVDAEVDYGRIEISPSWADISALSESATQRENAANMLFDRTLHHLQMREEVNRFYHVTVVNIVPLLLTDDYGATTWGPPIYPGDLVLIDYYDATPDGAFIVVNEQFVVMSADWRQDNSGRIAIELVLSPRAVYERTQAEVVASELQQSRAARSQRVPR